MRVARKRKVTHFRAHSFAECDYLLTEVSRARGTELFLAFSALDPFDFLRRFFSSPGNTTNPIVRSFPVLRWLRSGGCREMHGVTEITLRADVPVWRLVTGNFTISYSLSLAVP